jgi:GST-like protein
MEQHVVYGVPGWGSVLAELAFAWCDVPYDYVDVEGFDRPGPAREVLLAVNPLAQVPTVVLGDGRVLTESAAIMLWLAEEHPDRGLAPAPGTPERTGFLRRLVWLIGAVYPTFTYGDYPERWAPGDPDGLRASTDAHRAALWRQFEADLGAGPWVLGARPSALDLYVGVMVRWRPRRAWFETHCPRLAAIAAAVPALPRLTAVYARNFPDA